MSDEDKLGQALIDLADTDESVRRAIFRAVEKELIKRGEATREELDWLAGELERRPWLDATAFPILIAERRREAKRA